MDFGASGSFRQVAACLVASLPVFMAGIVLGWPSPVIGYMSLERAPVPLTPTQTSWMVACIDVGNFAMAVPAGRLMDRMGRKFTVSASAPIMFAGWMLILFGRQAWCLYLARLVQGAAVGIAWVVAPAYVGEMASVRIRGKLGLMVQLSYAGGLLFAYAAGWLLNDYAALAVASAAVSVAAGALFAFLPESPYYLVLDGRPDDAAKSLEALRSYADSDQLRAELVVVRQSVLNDKRRGTIGDLLNRDRRPLVIAGTLAVLQMACGASVLEAYASTVLSASPVSANACAVLLGLTIVAAAVPFALAVDRCGRRPLMIASCLGTAACHAATACLLWQPAAAGRWVPLFASVAGAQFFINIGLMPLLSVVQCEYFPSDTRALADTAVVLIVTLSSTVVIAAYPAFGQAVNFAAYAVLSLAGGVFCCAFMPETKCKSFGDIHTDFRRADSAGNGDDRACEYEEI